MQENDFQPKDWFAGAKSPEGLSKDEAWSRLQSRVDLSDTPVVKLERKRTMWWAAAAVAIIAVAVAFLLPTSNTDEFTAGQESRSVNLPDGSTVLLEAYATIRYDADSWSRERSLELKGGAFFSVQEGSAFTVETDLGSVQVLGTSFDVEADQGSFEVACYSGKVAVTHADEKIELKPGMITSLSGDHLTTPTLFKVFRHHDGSFHFEDVRIEEIFDALSQAYDVTFEGDYDHDLELTIDVDSGQALEEALDAMSLVGNFRYVLNEGKVQVTTK